MKPVIKRIGDEVIEQYPSIAEAARQNKISLSNIIFALKKTGRKCGGFYWDFA